ncbi:hypothetical protein JCM8547_008503 [Rhodosporidiobolus lusitaniae]
MRDSAPSPHATRLLVTKLHPSVAAHHLREHLARCPPSSPVLTDVKVVAKANGSSRCIAFVGFKTQTDAERARAWAAGSWVAGDKGGTRVAVDWAKDARDAPRPSKRPRLAPAAAAEERDARFSEFMALMTPRKARSQPVEPDALASATAISAEPAPAVFPPSTAVPAGQSVPSLPAPSLPAVPSTSVPNGISGPSASDGAAEDETLTDAEYLAKRMRRTTEPIPVVEADMDWVQEGGDVVETVKGLYRTESAADHVESADAPALKVDSSKDRQALLESGRLFVRNLPFSTTSDELEAHFAQFGALEQVHIPIDSASRIAKGIAYITFVKPEDAVVAFEALDCTTFQGRLLHLLPAAGRPGQSSAREGASTLKESRLETRKKTAGQTFSWGTLYLNSDAALSAVADRLGVHKSALLDPSSSDPAVKVALAEAHTLAEIKQYFEAENVNLDALGRPGPRSSTCILVKNLPFGTTDAALRSLFNPFGTVARLLIPPSGTIAVVELGDAEATTAAWRALVYKQFGGSVLYLEKAPAAIWSPATAAAASTPHLTATSLQSTLAASSGEGPIDSSVPGATLFVKNLNFETTALRLRAAFDHLPEFAFARVQTKPDSRNIGKTLSMGFGFVGFRNATAAAAAKEARQGYVLDGHALEIRFAQRSTERPASERGASKPTDNQTTKLLVKNVPFEATRAELRQLFGSYGQLKSVRLPRKMDNKTRGFAFLEFATRRDAEGAFAALEHTHLLGRHLVLQWATAADEEKGRNEKILSVGRRGGKRKFEMDS